MAIFRHYGAAKVHSAKLMRLEDVPGVWAKARAKYGLTNPEMPKGAMVLKIMLRPDLPNEQGLRLRYPGSAEELLTHLPIKPVDWVDPTLAAVTSTNVQEPILKMMGGEAHLITDRVPSKSERHDGRSLAAQYFPDKGGTGVDRDSYVYGTDGYHNQTLDKAEVGEGLKNLVTVYLPLWKAQETTDRKVLDRKDSRTFLVESGTHVEPNHELGELVKKLMGPWLGG